MKPKALRKIEPSHDAMVENIHMSQGTSAKILNFTAQPSSSSILKIPNNWPFFFCKRTIDIVGSIALLFLLTPLLLGLALAVKTTSPGPILFRQPRYGHRSVLFVIYKFRTMRIDAQDVTGVQQAHENDPRLTPIGSFLRRSSLDELPQLINVLKGEMSLVGPRPHVPGMLAGGMLYEDLVPSYFERHSVKPGVTGLAQINGLRGPTDNVTLAKRRIEHDLRYIEALSLRQDIIILWKTFINELCARNGV